MKLSIESNRRLKTCVPDMQRVFERVAELWPNPIAIAFGHRGRDEQEKAFREGKSKAHFGESAHNLYLSEGVDAYPCRADGTIDWADTGAFYRFAGFVEGVATMLGVKLTIGADWDNDGATTDEKLKDLGHFEITDWKSRKPK